VTVCATGLAVFAANAAAGQPKSAPRPAAGKWKFQPLTGLVSGGFTLVGKTVKDVHGKAKHQTGCASGNFTVAGKFKITQVTFIGKHRQWTVGSGRNPSGGLAARPIHLTVGGHKQVDATMSIAFPGAGQLGAGQIDWGVSQVQGISPCSVAYHVAHS
jgi:hypothetical protein